MEIRFDGKVALVTGASTGIGAAIARGFGKAGAKVVVQYNRSEDEAKAVAADVEAAGAEVHLIQADVTVPGDIDKIVDGTVERFGRIDVLFNNAGALVQRSPVPEMSDELYTYVMDLNMTSVFRMCRRVIPIMKQQGGGSIINNSSIAARTGGAGGSAVYAASKAAVMTFTRGLAKEVAKDHIRVNAISPGVILTPFHERFTSPERMKEIVTTIPMGRAGEAEECVGTILYLASDALSGYVTGQNIEVNGGQYMA